MMYANSCNHLYLKRDEATVRHQRLKRKDQVAMTSECVNQAHVQHDCGFAATLIVFPKCIWQRHTLHFWRRALPLLAPASFLS